LEDEYYGAEVNLEKALTNIEAKLEKERKNLKAIDGMKNLYATTDPKQFKKKWKKNQKIQERESLNWKERECEFTIKLQMHLMNLYPWQIRALLKKLLILRFWF